MTDDGPAKGSAPLDAEVTKAADAAAPDDKGLARDIKAVVETGLSTVGRAGITSASSIADALEGAGRSLSRRVVDDAMKDTPPVSDQTRLAEALASKPAGPLMASGAVVAVATRVLPKLRPLQFMARRTPMWLLAGAVPALVASVSRGSDELGLVAAHLALRARAAGVEPDPERVRRAAIQVMSGSPVDPDTEPGHGSLVLAWLRRGGRAALPFTAGVATANPDGLAARAAEVDAKALAAA